MLDTNGIVKYIFVDLRLAQIANISAVSFQIYVHISLQIRSTVRRTSLVQYHLVGVVRDQGNMGRKNFLIVIFNDAVSFWYHTASVIDERISMEKGWETNGWSLKYSERNVSRCHFVHHKYHTDWPGIEPAVLFQTARRHMPEYNTHHTTRALS
jgi:hypothetical protein